ncbi:uracil-DNA glycosylase family protein [Methanobacterium sp. ACI-7]|uniref:uracil-DNA glycosylase family protein n=1 Tax=unclassified Methanobacterium TaxID=2627676 RepID=UPI0039C30856
MISKENAYKELVKKRKNYKFSKGLKNPSEIEGGVYDKEDHIGAWSKWQGNLNAEIMLIGQDWGDVDFFIKCKGEHLDDTPTNKNLRKLFKLIGIDIGYPNNPNLSAPVFFTNAILGLKEGRMNTPIKYSWVKNDAEEFLKPTIDIVNPKIIMTLGGKTYNAMAHIYGLRINNLKEIIHKNPIKLKDGKLLFAMYHCGNLGTANRKFELQKKDWEKIKEYL